jgi:uncharacterized protein (TIGR03435 family)
LINIPLRLLIRNAYHVQDRQIVDAPSWISAERFDIVAKAPADLPPPRPGDSGTESMMKALLAERFKLAVHHETRELPAYTLEPARKDGKFGPRLRASTVDCAPIRAARQRGEPVPEQQGVDRPQCGFRSQGGRATGGQMLAGGFPLSELVSVLSQILQQTVVDKTGLTGDFDFELRWAAETMPLGPTSDTGPSSGVDTNGVSIFTALQEQLGLKLTWGKGLVDVLVIDHVDRPTPD